MAAEIDEISPASNPDVPLTLEAFAKLQGRTVKSIQQECDKGYWPTVQFCRGGLRFINMPVLRKKLLEAEGKAYI